MPDSQAILDILTLQELPYPNVFTEEDLAQSMHRLPGSEGLKLRPDQAHTTARSLERAAPNSTAKNGPHDEIFDLVGYALPPGTAVSAQVWLRHCNLSVFPFPDAFLPERRFECSQVELAKRHFKVACS
ncbi:hypothetical protein P691DRAFT_360918 [Macrolepiota fuliginosa MF-IS2]|uniref:Uncharacterized protein n=1 Tax=Macrolepiota fuliginosa MF-IS2 TaxID=1400762 RepID=A0A9P5XHE8_9AGAR|nr:hypothetical protein P691DRAFT_360918 [Macrolepiota fuliginosa MF-IS2]